MESQEEYRQRVIRLADERNEFVTDVDGYVYWWPDQSPWGHHASFHLRWLADELDRRNAAWDKQITNYFDNESSSNPKD